MKIEEFLSSSYTPFHTIQNCENILSAAGFQKLSLIENWTLKQGGKYYVTKNQTSIVCFNIGKSKNFTFNIALAHSDSPCLRVKGNKLISSPQGKRVNVEVYGGLINYSMFDIPLKIAGRVIVENNGKTISKLVCSKQNFSIPSLAIHQNRDVNTSFAPSIQKDMLPLVGEGESVFDLVCPNEKVVDADLFVVSDVKPFSSGAKGEFLCSPRIDNLTSVFGIINAIASAKTNGISIGAIFDNEEIGSRTKQGGDGSFLHSVIERICEALSLSKQQSCIACDGGFMLSIDNGHAVHPAFLDKADPGENVKLNGGILIKYHTNYATDGFSSAQIKLLLEKNKIDYQDFYCNSDLKCGSTIGLLASSIFHMNCCDVGLGMLAMHSAVEMVGKSDIEKMTKFCKAFFETKFKVEN